MRKRNFVLFLVISIAILSTGVNALPDIINCPADTTYGACSCAVNGTKACTASDNPDHVISCDYYTSSICCYTYIQDCGSAGCSNGACVSGTTTTIGNCHTKPLWDWSYCSSSCKCNAGEGDCDSDAECNTGYCAKDVGTKYGQSRDMDVCENRVTTTTIQSGTTTTTISGSSTTTIQTTTTVKVTTTTTIKLTGKLINISVSSCKDVLCKQKSRYFLLNDNIFLEYNSSLKNISLEANLIYPDGTSEEITLPASIKAEQIGNHTVGVTASKQGYDTITKTVKFTVFENEADIPKDKSEWNIVDIAIAASIAVGLLAGYLYWKRRENKKVVKIITRKNTEKLLRMLRKRK